MIAAEVALAFNGANERKMWAARPHAKGGNELVHFTASTNLISLVLDCNTLKFQVRFNKVHASWGDYVRSIARSLHVVLTTLKASGLPFDCPDNLEGAEIVTTVGDGVTYVSMPVAHDPVMPELKGEPITFAPLLGMADLQNAGQEADALLAVPDNPNGVDPDECDDEGCPHFGTPHGHVIKTLPQPTAEQVEEALEKMRDGALGGPTD